MSAGTFFGTDAHERAVREELDRVLDRLRFDESLDERLKREPEETLRSLGVDPALVERVAADLGVLDMKCTGTCIANTKADCKYDTCRLTQGCGWTVCDETGRGSRLPLDPLNRVRVQLDELLERARGDEGLRADLLEQPEATLQRLGFAPEIVRGAALELGLLGKCDEDTCINDTGADCKNSTCRLNTDACGWTVCGKKTNYMPAGGSIGLRPLDEISAADFLKELEAGGGRASDVLVWPEKKKRELWAEPEDVSTLPAGEVIGRVRGEKKKLELETPPGELDLASQPGFDRLLDQLAEAVEARLRKRPG
jgi:hypothetical protein